MGSVNDQGILGGCYEIVDRFFGVADEGKPCRYGTLDACQGIITRLGTEKPEAAKLLRKLLGRIECNWKKSLPPSGKRRRPSAKNWRWESRCEYDKSRDSKDGDEVRLERNIVPAMGGSAAGWVNAVPTSSGLVDGTHDKHRNIDIVYSPNGSEFTFFELKMKANPPLFAAIEVLYRGDIEYFHPAVPGRNETGGLPMR